MALGFSLACLAGGLVAVGISDGAWAGWPCYQPCPPPVRLEQRIVTCYRPEFRTELREVKRTV